MASPPASPPAPSAQSVSGLFSACQSLQSLIRSQSSPSTDELIPTAITPPPFFSLPTPPLAVAPPPLKLRLRNRGATTGQRKLTIKRLPPPRGTNKRRRALHDDIGSYENDSDFDHLPSDDGDDPFVNNPCRLDPEEADSPLTPLLPLSPLPPPMTPKRSRIAPEVLPLGLSRSDFHDMYLERGGAAADDRWSGPPAEPSVTEIDPDGEEWSAEDDRVLVELVLEKLKLSRSDWHDCARSLGKRGHQSVDRRWRSLVVAGDVGLTPSRSARRAGLHATWR